MKELSQLIDLELLKSLKIYILGIVISSSVYFLKSLMQGDYKALKNATQVSNEVIHLRQEINGKGILSYINIVSYYLLYGCKCLLQQVEPLIIAGGSGLIIFYLKKKPEIISSLIPLKKIPIEFQELIPLIPATLIGIFGSFSRKVFQYIYSVLPSKYNLPTNNILKTEDTKTRQVNVTNIIQEVGSNIRNLNINNYNVKIDQEIIQTNISFQKKQFTPELFQALAR